MAPARARLVRRSTCTITIPPEFFVACAIESVSNSGCFTLHRHVALLVGGRAAHERHVDRAAGIEQELLALELDDPHHLLRRGCVHPTALDARVNEGAEPDPRDQARAAGGRLAVEMADHALWKAVGLDLSVERERAQRRDEPPVPPDRAPDQSLAREAVQPAGAAVPGSRGEHEREVARAAGIAEALSERHEELVGNADSDESANRQRVMIDDQCGGGLWRDDFRVPSPALLLRH